MRYPAAHDNGEGHRARRWLDRTAAGQPSLLPRRSLATFGAILSQQARAHVAKAQKIDQMIDSLLYITAPGGYIRRDPMNVLPSTSFAISVPAAYSTMIGTATIVCVIGSIDGVTIAATTTASRIA